MRGKLITIETTVAMPHDKVRLNYLAQLGDTNKNVEILSGLYLIFRYNFLETIATFFNRLNLKVILTSIELP